MSDNTSEKRPEHPLKKQRAAFSVQKRNAKQRGIEWKFTFAEWWAWWQADDRWSNRGLKKGQLVMARNGDAGPYSPENVYCATTEQNLREMARESDKYRAAWVASGHHSPIYNRGAGNPNSKPIETPEGRFACAGEAAEHFGITKSGIRYRIKVGMAGWRDVNDEAA